MTSTAGSQFTDALDDLAECDLVAEAAIEDEEAKTAIFTALGKVVRPDALLTSNTSSIPIMKLAAATPGPERVVGMHFFNPATVMPLVEVIPCELTSQESVQRVQEFAHRQARQDHHHRQGPGRVRRQRAADPVPAGGHPHGRSIRRHGRTSLIARSPTSTPGGGDGFRSTMPPTSAMRWRGSTRSTSRTTRPVSERGSGCSTRRRSTGSCPSGS